MVSLGLVPWNGCHRLYVLQLVPGCLVPWSLDNSDVGISLAGVHGPEAALFWTGFPYERHTLGSLLCPQ